MRMFLVAMCDIFLLLYLTVVSQQEGSPASKITLKDYKKLESIQKESEKKEGKVEKEILALNDERKLLLKKLELAEKKAEEIQRKTTENISQQETEKKEALKLAEEERLKALEKTKLAEDERLKALEKTKLAEQERLLAIEKQIKAEEDAKAAQEAQKKALEEVDAAKNSEQLALAIAAREKMYANEKEKMALLTAEKAVLSEEKALAAQKSEAKKTERLNSVLQPAEKAFHKNIQAKLATVIVTITRDSLFGERGLTLGAVAAPVSFSGKSVIFQSLADLKIDRKFDDLLELHLEVDGKPVTSVLMHPGKKLIGFVTSAEPPSTKTIDDLASSMPTMVAVRNDSERKFSDRIRSVDPVKFFIQRDKISSAGADLYRYQVEGIRGTGDYGEVVMRGDQIVDLEGNLLGVATDRNLITAIGSASEWTLHSANKNSLRKLFSEEE